MESGLDFNYAALLALILNDKLTIEECFIKMGLAEQLKMPEKIKSADLENIKYLYQIKQMKLNDIGKIYNTTGVTIATFMKNHFIELRTRGNRAKVIN